MQIQQQLHYITQHYITLRCSCNYRYIALHDATLQLQLHYFTLQCTRLHYTKLQYTTIHYTNYTTPQVQLQLQLHYTSYITWQLQLKTTTYNYNSATLQLHLQLHLQLLIQLHYTTLHPAVVGEVTTATIATTPFGPSVDSHCHPWVTTTNPSYRFPLLSKLPPLPCAVLLVIIWRCKRWFVAACHGSTSRRKFRSQTSDNMDRWKAEQGRGREKRKIRREKIRREKSQNKEDADARKGRKVARNIMFFQWFGAPEGRKVGSLKRRVRSQLARWEMKICTPLWREGHFEVKMYKTPQCRTTFGSSDVEKVHAVVARSTFPSQNVQNTSVSDDFWKFRCRKSACRCGAKHISKSKCTKH